MTRLDTAPRTGIDLSEPALWTLIGPAGAGKSTVAAAFPAQWRLSLDDCRARVADDAGNQRATPDAVAVFHTVLEARVVRGLPTVVDATNTDSDVRRRLTARAYAHYTLPAVAITVRKPLAVCQERQAARSANRRVPPEVIAAQHDAMPTNAQLLAEGFAAVHDASDLDLLGLLLARSAATQPDLLADVRAVFGDDLAAVFAADPGRASSRGAFAVAGRTVAVRRSGHGGAYAGHWQARADTEHCDRCGGVVWAAVDDAVDLLAVYRGDLPDDLHCDRCDAPA